MSPIAVGLNGRFFPNNWRPALQEIAFAREHGFRCIQVPGRDDGLSEKDLGAPFAEIAQALADATVTAVMEIVVRIGADGRTSLGRTPLDVYLLNLPAIRALPCTHVHWHLVPVRPLPPAENAALERSMYKQFTSAVEIARRYGFKFGFEHNEPDIALFAQPDACAAALDAVDGLCFVWDVNHTIPAHLDDFCALIPRMSMLHISDTPLPEVNYHLPVGMGTINFAAIIQRLRDGQFSGPAVLEIGGLPKSGGFGRDTDAALIQSMQTLNALAE